MTNTLLKTQRLPSGLDYPMFPFSELQKILTPHTYVYQQYLIYVTEIPLLLSQKSELYKILPFPIPKADSAFMHIDSRYEYIFTNQLRQQYGKMNFNEFQSCLQPNYLTYVCKADIPIHTFQMNKDCESTLLHPSIKQLPESCEVRIIKLQETLWIPSYMSNEWLFTFPTPDKLTIVCDDDKSQFLTVENTGKLKLNKKCKLFNSNIVIYASTIITSNKTDDFMPLVELQFDCCFDFEKTKDFQETPLDIPFKNILSSMDDLRLTSLKVDHMDQLIKEQEAKSYAHWYVPISLSSGILSHFFNIQERRQKRSQKL